jgi:hypothetical protein
MGDPLSITASVLTVISAGIAVTNSLVDFYTSYKHQDSKLRSTTEKLQDLLDIFESLRNSVSNRKFQLDEQSLVEKIEASILTCEEMIEELRSECEKFNKSTAHGFIGVVQVAGRRATYPFRKSTLEKLDEDIDEIRDNLNFALAALQLKDHQRIQNDIDDIKQLLDLIRTSQISADVREWLKAPDAAANHSVACAKRHPGTGIWFVKSPVFSKWLVESNSFLWLRGFAGTGKSILCSTAIQYVFQHRRSDPNIGVAFFYFSFNDNSKQDQLAMLRALLLQFSGQVHDGHADLNRLFKSYNPSIPPAAVLIDQLHRLMQTFHHAYIVLDALDESPRNEARELVLETLEMMRKWALSGLHLLVTSRDEIDIRDSLSPFPEQQVNMNNDEMDKDIAAFISCRLHDDRRLQKWSSYHDKIQETLVSRARGM